MSKERTFGTTGLLPGPLLLPTSSRTAARTPPPPHAAAGPTASNSRARPCSTWVGWGRLACGLGAVRTQNWQSLAIWHVALVQKMFARLNPSMSKSARPQMSKIHDIDFFVSRPFHFLSTSPNIARFIRDVLSMHTVGIILVTVNEAHMYDVLTIYSSHMIKRTSWKSGHLWPTRMPWTVEDVDCDGLGTTARCAPQGDSGAVFV